jgi:hypothetical protein
MQVSHYVKSEHREHDSFCHQAAHRKVLNIIFLQTKLDSY